MEQRQLRLGDILDDYCTREHRITNHAVVAMVGSDVKQTRCTTCDAEHAYKKGRVPSLRKKKDAKTVLYDQVLAAATKDGSAPGVLTIATPAPAILAVSSREAARPVRPPEPDSLADGPAGAPEAADVEHVEQEGPVHRPLIRATLPRTGGQTVTRPAPEFTIRQAGGRPSKFSGSPAGGGHHSDHRQKGRSHAGQGVNSRGPVTRPGAGPRHAGHSGQPVHAAGMRPGQHPHQARHSQAGGVARSQKKPSR